jgi:formylglycine-generating enzyme required for sulfatase activity
MSKYEVTQAQWKLVMGSTTSKLNSNDNYEDRGPNKPMVWIGSKEDIAKFNDELSYLADHLITLPSEAQWEYACKAGQDTRYCGSDILKRVGWYEKEDETNHVQDVGSKEPNAWGLYNMSGNAWEVVEDCWHDNYRGAPTDGSAWTTECTKDLIVRGGSAAVDELSDLEVSHRLSPYELAFKDLGFRVVVANK